MKWDVPSFARYFIILLIAFLIALYQLHVFRDKIYFVSFSETKDEDF